jgi:hypothetical protein
VLSCGTARNCLRYYRERRAPSLRSVLLCDDGLIVMSDPTPPKNTGFDALLQHPLLETIWRRRTHRVSRGIPEIHAKSMTYRSPHKPLPLTELEEAILIAMTGHTGLTMPDRPFEDPATGDPIMAKPNLTMVGRAAGSPDNAQGTSFFMINDSGTYFIRKLPLTDNADLSASTLIEQARKAKVKILDRRIDPTCRVRRSSFPSSTSRINTSMA